MPRAWLFGRLPRSTPNCWLLRPSLKVVGRAGIGVDNIDVPAATERGILVVNAPQANTISAAEHALALLLAQARHIPEADAKTRSGVWDRKSFQGVELFGKTLGVIGLGRIGTLVSARATAFGMKVLAHDPFVGAERARRQGVDLVELDHLLAKSDFITIHLPLTPGDRWTDRQGRPGPLSARGANREHFPGWNRRRRSPGRGRSFGTRGRCCPRCLRHRAANDLTAF